MDHIGGMGGFSPFGGRLKQVSLSARGERALSLFRPDSEVSLISEAHKDTEALRKFAERFAKKRRPNKESVAKFEMEVETGQISINIYDAETGHLELKLSPEEVAEGLKNLEETSDNDAPLSSFFVDK